MLRRRGLLLIDVGARSLASARPRAFAFLVLAAASWGTGTVLSKGAVAEVPPLSLLTAQLVVSVTVLGLAGLRDRSALRRLDRRLVALGVLNPGIAYALSLFGLTTISASVSVLIWAIEPILILLLAAVVLSERVGARIALLSGLSLAGLVVVLNDPAARVDLVGAAATITGVGCCAIYSVGARRWITAAPSTLGIVFGQQLVATGVAAAALAAAAMAGVQVVPTDLTAGGVASVVASGILYYGAAYLLYLSALRELPASIAAISFYLVPIFGVAVAMGSGEALTVAQWAGAAVTVGAVLSVGGLEIRRSSTA